MVIGLAEEEGMVDVVCVSMAVAVPRSFDTKLIRLMSTAKDKNQCPLNLEDLHHQSIKRETMVF